MTPPSDADSQWDLSALPAQSSAEHVFAVPGPGTRIDDRFEVLGTLGRGGAAVVLLASDLRAGRQVALKLLSERQDRETLARFEREGRVLAGLSHPGILRVYSSGALGDRPYLVLELVEGARSLREVLPERTLQQRVALIREVAAALGHAHAHGVVHRDVKADNVLVGTDGRARLGDFGLALVTSLERLTRSADVLGTAHYMAPEQIGAERDAITPATDVWALGVLLYRAMTLVLPFQGTLLELRDKIRSGVPLPPRAIDPALPEELETICLRCMARRPEDRFRDGVEVAHALGGFLEAQRPRGRRRWGRRRVAAASLPLLTAGALMLTVGRPLDGRPPASAAEALEELSTTQPLRALAEVERLLPDASPGERVRLERLRASCAGLAIASALERGDLDGALELAPAAPGHPATALALALAGRPPGPGVHALPPEERARVHAWRGDVGACLLALRELDPAPARALATELGRLLPDLEPPRPPPDSDAPWDRLARADAELRAGHVGSAAAAFGAVLADAPVEEVRFAARIGLAQVAVAQGDLIEADRLLAAASTQARTPLERVRCMSWQLQVSWLRQAPELDARLRAAMRGAPGAPGVATVVALAARDAPEQGAGGPRRADGEALLDGPVTDWPPPRLLDPDGAVLRAARSAAAEADPTAARRALARAGVSADEARSFADGERLALARGADGAVGLLLARGIEVVEAARRGQHPSEARRGLSLLAAALRLRPTSPAGWTAAARGRLLLGDHQGALAAARRALAASPDDPRVLLTLAEVHEGAAADAALRADLARVTSADTVAQDQAAAAARLDPALDAGRRAAEAAAAAGVLEREARVALARVIGARGQRLAAGRGGPIDAEHRDEVERALEPLLRGIDVAAVVAARRSLGAALLTGDEARIAAAEEALAAAIAAPCGPAADTIDALVVAASLGGEHARARAEACVAVVGDLPARALLVGRRARAIGAPVPQRAGALAAWLPPITLALGRAACDELAAAADRAPERMGQVLAGALGRPPGRDPLARALALVARGDPAAYRSTCDVVAARPGAPAAHLLRARALAPLPTSDARLLAEAQHDLRCAAAAAPWSTDALVELILHTPDDGARAALQGGLLEHGLFAHPAALRPWPWTHGALADREALAAIATGDPTAAFRLAARLGLEEQSPALAVALRLVPAPAVSYRGGVEDPLDPTSFDALTERLGEEHAVAALLARAEHRIWRRHYAANQGQDKLQVRRALRDEAIALALRALAAARSTAPGALGPALAATGVDLIGGPGARVEAPRLWEARWRLGRAVTALELIAWANTLRPEASEERGLLRPETLLQPHSIGQWFLLTLQETRSQELAFEYMLEEGELAEALLAADRAAAFARAEPASEVMLRLLVQLRLEAAACKADPARRDMLDVGRVLLERARALGAPLATLEGAGADLAMDLAAADADGRARWCQVAERSLERAAGSAVEHPWRRVRFAALAAEDGPASVAALDAALADLEAAASRDGAALQRAIRLDPARKALEKHPRVGPVLERVLSGAPTGP